MPWIGTPPNQTYQRSDGVRSGDDVYQQQQTAGINIEAVQHDAAEQDIASALSSVLKRDGGNTASADIPMGGNKLTGLGSGSAAGDSVPLGQAARQVEAYVNDTGAADAYVAAPSPAWTAYANGNFLRLKISNTNTGAATLDVSGLGAKAINGPHGNALGPGALVADRIYDLVFIGSDFTLVTGTSAMFLDVDQALSGTAVPWTNLPTGLDFLNVNIDGASLSAIGNIQLQLGDSGGFEATGYISGAESAQGFLSLTTAFLLTLGLAASTPVYGQISLIRRTGNTWVLQGDITDGTVQVISLAGRKTLSGELTQVQLLASAGTFSAGNANISFG